MVRIDMRRIKAENHQGRLPPRTAGMLELERERSLSSARLFQDLAGRNEVRECGTSYAVNMRLKTCVCRRWEMSGVPCRHALRIIADKIS